jgi:DeoR/GlpR family transcriptional regulator of sugar metabolism
MARAMIDFAPPVSTLQELPPGLMRRQAYFLSLLAAHPSLTRRDYQKLAGISHTTASQDLAELLAAGLIVRHGSARSCRYSLAARHRPHDHQTAIPSVLPD